MQWITILQYIPAFIGLLVYIAVAFYLLTSRACRASRGGAALRCSGVVMLLTLLQFPIAIFSANRGVF